jgi:hypothetical protein
LPQLETIISPEVIQQVLTEYEAWEQREKKPHLQALCQRRQQLAVTPLRALFARIARPQARPETRTAFRFGLRVVAVDGTRENLPDTDANRTVFPSHCQEELSRSPFPQARCVLLMECGTHVICDAGICCGPVLQAARRTGGHVLGRLDSHSWSKPWVRLHDGSYLVSIARDGKQQRGHALTARVIEYRVKDPQTGQLSAPIRLITTLLDPKQDPIEALIRL